MAKRGRPPVPKDKCRSCGLDWTKVSPYRVNGAILKPLCKPCRNQDIRAKRSAQKANSGASRLIQWNLNLLPNLSPGYYALTRHGNLIDGFLLILTNSLVLVDGHQLYTFQIDYKALSVLLANKGLRVSRNQPKSTKIGDDIYKATKGVDDPSHPKFDTQLRKDLINYELTRLKGTRHE